MDRTRCIGCAFYNLSINRLKEINMKKGIFVFAAFLFAVLITACGGKGSSVQYNPQDYAGTYYGKGNSIVYADFNAEDMTVYVCIRTKSMTTYGYTSNWRITKRGMEFKGESPNITVVRGFDGYTKLIDSSGDDHSFGTLNKK